MFGWSPALGLILFHPCKEVRDMSLEPVVVQSPSGRVINLSPEDVAAGRLADLEGRGYKRVKDAKGPSSNVRPAVVSPEPPKPPVVDHHEDE